MTILTATRSLPCAWPTCDLPSIGEGEPMVLTDAGYCHALHVAAVTP